MAELVLQRAALASDALVYGADTPFALAFEFVVGAPIVFDVDATLEIVRVGEATPVMHARLRAPGWDVAWLPRGSYRGHALAPRADLPAGQYRLQLTLWHHIDNVAHPGGAAALAFSVSAGAGSGPRLSWQLESLPGTPPVEALSWKRGNEDWFHRHFEHAARTAMSYLLGDSPLLKGRILDVGCGDGITDLGIALRKQPQELVGIDPFRGYERLPQILERVHLRLDRLPECLRFLPADANAIPFDDDHFDVVLSWGSVEHIAGGYAQALREIRRVLKPDGLLFIHPGLYYSDLGHHLGEFAFARAEPYVHLKRPREWLRERVLGSTPDYIDRSGEFATAAQYWQWFTELNPITVPGFERELRELGFEPWRVALRTHDRVDYTPELQGYNFVDLGVAELYLSAYNRKPAA